MNPGPSHPCGVCGGSTTSRALQCGTCETRVHQKCSGVSRAEMEQRRQTNSFRCQRCNQLPQTLPVLCNKCGRGFRFNQNRLTCGTCNLPTHLNCTELTRLEREQVERGSKTWFCCHRPVEEDVESPPVVDVVRPAGNRPTDPIDAAPNRQAEMREKMTCAQCNNLIRQNCPRAVCTNCGGART